MEDQSVTASFGARTGRGDKIPYDCDMAHETIRDQGTVLGWNPFMKWGVVQVEEGAAKVVVQAGDLDPEAGITDLTQGARVEIEYHYERSGAYEYRADRVRPLESTDADTPQGNAEAHNG
jgi:cold shock CspA family protein